MWRREDGQGINIERRKKGKPETQRDDELLAHAYRRYFSYIFRVHVKLLLPRNHNGIICYACSITYTEDLIGNLFISYIKSHPFISLPFLLPFCCHFFLFHLFLPFTVRHVFLLCLLAPRRWNRYVLLNYIRDVIWHIYRVIHKKCKIIREDIPYVKLRRFN